MKVILNLAVSLDGFIADPVGGYGWIRPSGETGANTKAKWSHEKFLQQISTVVMGKRCYDQGLHAEYGDKQVFVVTSETLCDRDNLHFITGDVCGAVNALRKSGDGGIYLFGGGICIDPLLKAGMIDEYIIGIIPIILGDGIPLFLHGNPEIPLHLTHTYVEDGIVVLRYVPRGTMQ